MTKRTITNMARNAINYIVLFATYLSGLVSGKPSIDAGGCMVKAGENGAHAGNDRPVIGTSPGISGNDIAYSPPRRGPYLGECVGPCVCYFIGSHEMYKLVREASERAGLANVPSFFRTLEVNGARNKLAGA